MHIDRLISLIWNCTSKVSLKNGIKHHRTVRLFGNSEYTNVWSNILRYLFQLTANLSPLSSHKRRNNFSDTRPEICECNLCIEHIRHFLFECPSYATQRATLTVSVIDILQRNNLNHLGNQPELYLYGHPSVDLIDNRQVLITTKDIKDTEHFSTSPFPVTTVFDLFCLCYIFVNFWFAMALVYFPAKP